jgi:hypothetical protein
MFMVYFVALISLQVEVASHYYHLCLDTHDRASPVSDVIEPEILLFPAVVHMGHHMQYMLKDYWSMVQPFFMSYYGKGMSHDIPQALHF